MSAQVPVLGGKSGGSGWGGDLSGFICQADTAAELWPRSWRNRRQGHLQTETAAGQLRRQWRPGHSPGRDGGGEVVGHGRRGSVRSWGGIDDRGGAAGHVVRAPVPG